MHYAINIAMLTGNDFKIKQTKAICWGKKHNR